MSKHDGETDEQLVERVLSHWFGRFPRSDRREARQVAWLEMLESKRRYDPNNERGATFATYATGNIKFALMNLHNDAKRITGGGAFRNARSWVWQNAENGVVDLAAFRARWPGLASLTDDEIRHGVAWCLRSERSLDSPCWDDASTTLGETLPAPEREDPTPPDPLIARFASGLCDRERVVFDRRLLADDPETLPALGTAMGLSRTTVRRIENGILRRLRTMMARDGARWVERLRPSARGRVRARLVAERGRAA